MVRAHQVQVGIRMIFSVVVVDVVLIRMLLGGFHRQATAGYKLIAKRARKPSFGSSFDRQIQTEDCQHFQLIAIS